MANLIKINIMLAFWIICEIVFIQHSLIGRQLFSYSNKLNDSTLTKQCVLKIDSIAEDGIKRNVYPGCQIVVLLNGKLAFQKSFGYHTYDNKEKVLDTDLYDLASLTKVAATTLCLMKLYEEGKINLNDNIGKYLPYLKNSNKEKLILKDILTHQAGLQDWIPFYKTTLKKDNSFKPGIFSKTRSESYSISVADKLFLRTDYQDTIIKQIINSPLLSEHKYHYSDLGFYLLADLIEKVSGKRVNEYVYDNFYKPMGLNRITYLPLEKFSLKEIIPTENDTIFRKQLIHGYVHDPGAAMLGGIAGHAGLFSDAIDLAYLFQMLLDKGKYKDKSYLKASTVKEFTKVQFPYSTNRRGLGFDKPIISNSKFKIQNSKLNYDGPCAASASANSYGHSGFTGTFVWADPDYKLVYVFLSNRIYPSAENHKITKLNIRTKIQQLIYDYLKKYLGIGI